MPHLATGKVFAGRYRLQTELGAGGCGAVWVALDDKLSRKVAIKVMKRQLLGHDIARSRFEQEAKTVARLRSPHIVQLFDYGIEDDVPFMVMELLGGQDLLRRLSERKRLPLAEVAEIVFQTARALQTAHEAGVIHRDLKPANIFLVPEHDGEFVKVLDFGLAKAIHDPSDGPELTADGAMLGTPRYMSPEQAHGAKSVDRRTDLWSLGVVAYFAITGQAPFAGTGTGEIITSIATSTPLPPSELVKGLPPELDAFFVRALAKSPDERFQTARTMAVELDRILGRREPRSSSPSQRGLRPFPSDPGLLESGTPRVSELSWGEKKPAAGEPSQPTRMTGEATSVPATVPAGLAVSQPLTVSALSWNAPPAPRGDTSPAAPSPGVAHAHAKGDVTTMAGMGPERPRPGPVPDAAPPAPQAACALGPATSEGVLPPGAAASPLPATPGASAGRDDGPGLGASPAVGARAAAGSTALEDSAAYDASRTLDPVVPGRRARWLAAGVTGILGMAGLLALGWPAGDARVERARSGIAVGVRRVVGMRDPPSLAVSARPDAPTPPTPHAASAKPASAEATRHPPRHDGRGRPPPSTRPSATAGDGLDLFDRPKLR